MTDQLSMFDALVPAATSGGPICKMCGNPFVMKVNGAGVKYCSLKCKRRGYNKQLPTESITVSCPACLTDYDRHPRTGWNRWGLCKPCMGRLMKSGVHANLANHKAPVWIVLELLKPNPECDGCGTPLLEKIKTNAGWRYNYAVDHDHSCCTRALSCGRCVRGVLCKKCNTALGYMDDNPRTAENLASYLKRNTPAEGAS